MEEKKTIKRNHSKVWLIAYINRSFIDSVTRELIQYDYDDIEAYIPTVRVLRKTFKGQRMFEFVPLLFNYGFFKVPYQLACSAEALLELRSRITAIYGWVKDPTVTLLNDGPGLRFDNENFINAKPKAAVATDKEVARMIKASESMSIFSAEDLARFKPGQYIKLEGYPFDNMPAEIVKINPKKREVKVKLLMDAIVKEVTVSFDNVFYSIYKNYDEYENNLSSDEMNEKFGENAIDNIILDKNFMDYGE